MPIEVTVSAVGDIMMKNKLILSAQLPESQQFDFDGMFEEVAPVLRSADLTIGNLETTFAGTDDTTSFMRQPRNPKTRYPLFNCPDDLAPALKRAGFDVLTTANNHCMDYGIAALQRTLNILDQNDIAHTGTFRTLQESKQLLIKDVKGIKIGVLAYTLGTNSIRVKQKQQWAVNRIRAEQITNDLRRLKKKTDFVIVSMHFGREYELQPSSRQKRLVRMLFKHGANMVLGAHPHVIQPAIFTSVRDVEGVRKKRFAIYSLGNFITTRLKRNNHTKNGVIAQFTLAKDDRGEVEISSVEFVPTWVKEAQTHNGAKYQIVPLGEAVDNPTDIETEELLTMHAIHTQVAERLALK
ncbi:CapA family protein [Paenibacillus xerothermodurans]|nr:CapA family protein [Paenibacillus xerothermodurans]